MKKILSIILSLSISIVLFMSCSNDSASPVLPIIPPVSPTSSTAPVTFDFSNAKAIAHMGESSSRSAADSEEYVKILTDGTFEAAIKLTGTGSLAKVVGIYPSKTNSGDVFVAFQENSNLYSGFTPQSIGQLICVHSDGTFDDILKIGNNVNYWANYLRMDTKSITFDKNGNAYFFAKIERDSNGNWINNAGQQIYQYKPAEKQLNKLVAAVEGTTYEKMQISGDNALIFAQGYRNINATITYFLRAIPISDPGNFNNIYYGENYINPRYSNWTYDDNTGKMYFIGRIGNEPGLYSYSRNANFNDGTLKCASLSDIISNYFERFFSGEITASELLSKLSIFFVSDFDFRIQRFTDWNSNTNTSIMVFSELNNETLENENALNWIKGNTQRQTDFWTYYTQIKSNSFYEKGSVNTKLTMNSYCFDSNDYYYNWSSYITSGIVNISSNNKGLYAWGKSNNGLIFIHIADEDGNFLYDVKKISLPVTGKVTEAKMYGTEIFMKYVLTNSNDAELGYHHIYSINCLNAQLKNYFDTFTNKNTMEVVSYSVGADNLYFSFVNGLNVENYVIDLNTNNARRLETNRKMIDVFAF